MYYTSLEELGISLDAMSSAGECQTTNTKDYSEDPEDDKPAAVLDEGAKRLFTSSRPNFDGRCFIRCLNIIQFYVFKKWIAFS